MKRFCISPVTGMGTIADPFRAAVGNVSGVNAVASIPTGSNGHPLYHFCMARVGTASGIAAVAAVTNTLVFPDVTLDTLLMAVPSQTLADLGQSVSAYDLTGAGQFLNGTVNLGVSFRDNVNGIGRQMDPLFDVDHFDCTEPTS